MSTTREKMIERAARAIENADPCHIDALAAAVIDAIGAVEMAEALDAFGREVEILDKQREFSGLPRMDDDCPTGTNMGAVRRARAALAKALSHRPRC